MSVQSSVSSDLINDAAAQARFLLGNMADNKRAGCVVIEFHRSAVAIETVKVRTEETIRIPK